MRKCRSRDLFNYTGTVAEFEKHLQSIVRKSYKNGLDVTGNQRNLLLSLFQESRQDKGPAPVSVRGELNTHGNGVHAVFVFEDGSEDIVSLPKARWRIDNPGESKIGLRRLQEALRHAIRPQVNEIHFKVSVAMAEGAPLACPISGAVLTKPGEVDVHHAGAGKGFVDLIQMWADDQSLRGRDIRVKAGPNGEGTTMADVNQRQSWYRFHALHAELVAVDRAAHRKLGKSRLSLGW